MQEIVATVAESLGRVDPEHAASYSANAEAYSEQLAALDQEYAQGLADCARDEIVTAHEAFGWLARRYGLEQHAIAGIAPDQEPSAERIAELSDLAERDGVTTIFTETLVSPRVAETLAREAGGLKTATLNPLEGLGNDEIDAGADYLSVMRDNLQLLRDAVGARDLGRPRKHRRGRRGVGGVERDDRERQPPDSATFEFRSATRCSVAGSTPSMPCSAKPTNGDCKRK